jgi:hypothetical protein
MLPMLILLLVFAELGHLCCVACSCQAVPLVDLAHDPGWEGIHYTVQKQ